MEAICQFILGTPVNMRMNSIGIRQKFDVVVSFRPRLHLHTGKPQCLPETSVVAVLERQNFCTASMLHTCHTAKTQRNVICIRPTVPEIHSPIVGTIGMCFDIRDFQ